MPKSFSINEPSAVGTVDAPFGVRSNGTPIFECVRIIMGSVDLLDSSKSRMEKLRHCYVSQKARRLSTRTIDSIIDVIFDGSLTTGEAKSAFLKSRGQNEDFWNELKGELCFCIVAHRRNRSVEAFLHLYRIYELISVALPLIYATRLTDFREALGFIKSLSNNDRDQDLAILKYFANAIAKTGSYSALYVDFPFSGLSTTAATSLVEQLKAKVLNKNIGHRFFAVEEEGISIQFASIPGFIVGCRNRLFHNALSNDNFKVDAIHGAAPLCNVLVAPGMYWFGIVLSEIAKTQAARYV